MTDYDGVRTESATEELRRLLDERGAEWIELVGHPVVVGTAWYDRDGCSCAALEHADDVPDGMLSVHANLTPEQAIAETLGAGTCEVDATIKWDWDRCEPYWEHELSCGHTVTTMEPEPPHYCPNCGRRVEVDDG